MNPLFHSALIGLCLMLAQMAALWAWHLRLKNAAIVDVGWAAGLGLLAGLYALLGSAPPYRRLLMAALVGAWAFRLAGHLYRDRIANRAPEEGRYVHLRSLWGDHAPFWFFWFFLGQGVLNVLLSLPFLLAAFDPHSAWSVREPAAMGLWLLALCGESLADAQLRRFKADPDNKGQVCRTGLWGVSRHPNYFCEWLIWCAYALLALGAPWGWLGAASPLIILFLLLKVSGIPPTEAQALRGRPLAYARYQREVSAFFPWFRKRAAAAANLPRSVP